MRIAPIPGLVIIRNDPRLDAVSDERSFLPPGVPTAALDAVIDSAASWTPSRLAQELVEVAAEMTGAAQVALYKCDSNTVRCMGLAPPHLASPLLRDQQAEEFPWAMPSLQPSRFVLVEAAGDLPLPVSGRARDIGYSSAVHLPLRDGNRMLGALQIYWSEPMSEWDDRVGAALRALGVFTLCRVLPGAGAAGVAGGRRGTDT